MIAELPAPKEVRDLLLDLLGREVTMQPADAWAPLPHEGACVAEFVDDSSRLTALAVVDLPFAAYVGSALGLLPVGGAEDMVDEGRVSSMVVDNLYEVLNIASSLFNKDGSPHVKIAAMHGPGGPLTGDVGALARKLVQRLDCEVDVAGYGAGRIGFVLA